MHAKRQPFSEGLQHKIDTLAARRPKIKMGELPFNSPLLLAPMSAICNVPFRLLMEELGAGGTVSELISCHGINYKNEKTLRMLRIDPREENVGIQLFGEDPKAMAESAKIAQDYNPKFIDINMGCPVRKVVTKGGGSALMKDTSKLGEYFGTIKKAIDIPLTIKIRIGWDDESINADEVIRIAWNEGVEFVAVHGRTRAQQYRGEARWDYLESLNASSPLPLIGNGDLHTPYLVKERLKKTTCDALMLGRGPLRNPFLFLESYLTDDDIISFSPLDYLEVIQRLFQYTEDYTDRDHVVAVQMRKHIVWFAAGFPGAAAFRNAIFQTQDLNETLKLTEGFFLSNASNSKQIDYDAPFMTSGHG